MLFLFRLSDFFLNLIINLSAFSLFNENLFISVLVILVLIILIHFISAEAKISMLCFLSGSFSYSDM